MEPRFFDREVHFGSAEDVTAKQKRKSVSVSADNSCDGDDCFSCNICLESANDPVVTLCGHLYCWACIYKWLQVRNTSLDADAQIRPSCPVCKAEISSNSLVPLYGRGASKSSSGTNRASADAFIPHRPSALSISTIDSHQSRQLHSNLFQSHSPSQSQSFHHQQYFTEPYRAVASSDLGSAAEAQVFNPMMGMFADLIFSRTFGAPNTSLFAYSYPNSNSIIRSYNNPRMRRQELQLDKSLNRVTVFLFCCIILCLLLF